MIPSSGPAQHCSTAFAMAADALPAPMTMTRPAGRCGKCGGTHCAGCAASTAASNIARRSARAASEVNSFMMCLLD
jgi:hypothetical protein